MTKHWPRDETYSLIDQIRRSSRSIGANLAEVWAKRRYSAHFISKLSDTDGELQETVHWLKTACACGYLKTAEADFITQDYRALGRMLGAMFAKSDSFILP